MRCPDCGFANRDVARVECPHCRASLTLMPDGSAGVLGRFQFWLGRGGRLTLNETHPQSKAIANRLGVTA